MAQQTVRSMSETDKEKGLTTLLGLDLDPSGRVRSFLEGNQASGPEGIYSKPVQAVQCPLPASVPIGLLPRVLGSIRRGSQGCFIVEMGWLPQGVEYQDYRAGPG